MLKMVNVDLFKRLQNISGVVPKMHSQSVKQLSMAYIRATYKFLFNTTDIENIYVSPELHDICAGISQITKVPVPKIHRIPVANNAILTQEDIDKVEVKKRGRPRKRKSNS